jgi:hypothetical protein
MASLGFQRYCRNFLVGFQLRHWGPAFVTIVGGCDIFCLGQQFVGLSNTTIVLFIVSMPNLFAAITNTKEFDEAGYPCLAI